MRVTDPALSIRPAGGEPVWHGQAVVAADMTRLFEGYRPIPQRSASKWSVRQARDLAGAPRRAPRFPVRRAVLATLGIGGAAGVLAAIAVLTGLQRPGTTHPRTAQQVAASPTSDSPVSRPVATADLARPVAAVPARPAHVMHHAPARPAIKPVALRDAPVDGRPCDGNAGCGRAAVLAADRALREAYAEAISAGVDRDRLISIRDRWAKLRRTQYDRPGLLITRYQTMTSQLEHSTRRIADSD